VPSVEWENWPDSYYRATLTLRTAEEGGRTKPIASGYRASWDFGQRTPDGVPIVNDASLVLEDRDSLDPGEESPIRLYPLHEEYWSEVRQGQAVLLREGRRIIGLATISGWVSGGTGG
jgi:translation elongation factor EF-Tu-like GTPase